MYHNKPPKTPTLFIAPIQSILCERLLGTEDIRFKKQNKMNNNKTASFLASWSFLLLGSMTLVFLSFTGI